MLNSNELVMITKDNQLKTSSIKVSEVFDKRHSDVLKSIDDILKTLSIDFSQRNFSLTSHKIKMPNGGFRNERFYLLTKDGLIMLIMGYTGEKAMKFKEAYINAFNNMAKELQTRQALKLEYPAYQDAIKYAIENSDSANYKKFGFTQENNLIYVIALGMNAKKFREKHNLEERQSIRPYITCEQAEAIIELQAMNATFLKIGMEYDDRKLQLKKYFDAKYKAKQLH